jgi:uncharacterized protein
MEGLLVKVAFHRGLYDPGTEPPTLRGVRCSACGTVFFPPFGIGCEVCGAPEEALVSDQLAAAGIVHSAATVHRYAGEDIAAPFTIAEIQLDDGPLIRATLTDLAESEVIGSRAEGQWVTVGANDAGDEITELRFAVVAP